MNTQQTITDIDTNRDADNNDASDNPAETPKQQGKISALNKQLDGAVKSAIANGDLVRASALASTDEQRGWVNQAQKEEKKALQGRTEADLMAEKAASSDCKNAKQALQTAADGFPDSNEIAAKTSLMRTACGVKEPEPVIYSNPTPRFYGYPHNQGMPTYGSHLPTYPSQQHSPSNPVDTPKPKPDNSSKRFPPAEDTYPKH
ncbi:hypothetical protein [Methyloradius palustris]|uniref:hypothetical protein n=1 Tax=Methyloradius palustris TaxID=2778876 RepID=UPI001C8BAA2D|nr:hypothetical protein [Methyloradius palustris]